MTDEPIDFFAQRGFTLSFSEHTEDELAAIYSRSWSRKELRQHLSRGDVGRIFANLRGQNGLELKGYGTATSETAAANRAMQRWKQEQGD
jgi:hypothetical protein